MPDPSLHFLPYQLRWLQDESPIAIGEKSRRIGWTYTAAFRAVERRVRLKTNLYFSSVDLSAAREFIEYCQAWMPAFNLVTRAFKEEQVEPGDDGSGDGARAFVLHFDNGSKIVAGSSNPKFFRSKGGDADADEFAFHREARELYKAMQPAALVWGHQMRLWSTHNGEGSFFNQLVREARGREATKRRSDEATEGGNAGAGDGSVSPSFSPSSLRRFVASSLSLHTVTLIDAVNQGLVEKIRKLDAPDPVARRDFIEEVRASCPDEDAWNEEYLCRPSSENTALLSYALIQGCEAVEGGEWSVESEGTGASALPSTLHTPPSTSNFYAGFDVGRKHDRSVLWLVERVGDVLWTRGLRVLHDVNFTAQEQLLIALMQRGAVRRLCVDSTGIGAMLAERLVQRFGHRVEAIHFTAAVKSDLAMPLLRLFQDRLVRVPADPEVREDLHKVRKIVTASNHVRLEADRDDKTGHADRFWALALACHAAQEARPLPAPLARKPIEW